MGELRNAYKIWFNDLKGRDHLEDKSTDGSIIWNWVKKSVTEVWMDLTGSGPSQMAAFCEYCYEPLGSIKTETVLASWIIINW